MKKVYHFGDFTIYFEYEKDSKIYGTMKVYLKNHCIYNEFISIVCKNFLQNILFYIEPFWYSCKDKKISFEVQNLINTLQAKIYQQISR